MDTHVHAIVETPQPTLSSGMQRLLGQHAFEFNRRHGFYGHLFAGPYSACLIDSDEYALTACAYVVLNPVRAGLVRAPEDWPWSSYRATAGLIKPPAFLSERLLPAILDQRPGRARELYRELVRGLAEHPTPGSG
jgi:hypothetical protein